MALLVVISVAVTSIIIGLVICIALKEQIIYEKDFQVVGSVGGMTRIVEVIEVNGRDYVPLADYQRLMSEYEKLLPEYTTEEILATAGEDEVYTG